MPIKPENKARYPKNWKEIRARILERAGHKCELCGVPNYAVGVRIDGEFFELLGGWKAGDMWSLSDTKSLKVIKIILTIMHMDHTPENCADDNLKAGCQRCHNRYDQDHRQKNAAITRGGMQNQLAFDELKAVIDNTECPACGELMKDHNHNAVP